MTSTSVNRGIVIGGSGKLRAGVLAVGDGARASGQVVPTGDLLQLKDQLDALHRLIEEQSAQIQDADRLKQALAAVAEEAKRGRPSGFAMTSILESIAKSAASVTAVATAAIDLKLLVTRLFA